MDLVSNVVQLSLPLFISKLCSSIVVVRPVEVFFVFLFVLLGSREFLVL